MTGKEAADELRPRAESTLVRQPAKRAESRDRYRVLYDLAPVAHISLDRRGTIREANQAAVELLGTGRGCLIGRSLASMMTQEHADALHQHLQEAFERGGKHGCDLAITAQTDGNLREVPVHIDSIASSDANGKRSECRSVLIDLSELRAAQEGCQTSDERTRTLLDMAGAAIVSSDSSGRIETFNRAAERLFGYAEGEVLGENVQMLTFSPTRDEHDSYLSRNLSAGEARIIGHPSREVTGLRKDGSTLALERSIGEWWDRGQRKFTAVIRDLTERKLAEDAIRDSEARFRQIAEHVGDIFLLHDRKTRHVLYANPAFETVWGRPVCEIQENGDCWIDWVHPDDRQRVAEGYERMLQGDPFDEEYRVERPDQEVRWLRARNFPMDDLDGDVHRDVIVLQDITNERELEEELQEAQKMEVMGALASGVAHDFNNVLQAVLGCMNLARSSCVLPAAADKLLEHAARAARRGGDLAGQLMLFSRKRKANPVSLEIDATIEQLETLVQQLVTEEVSVEVRVAAPGEAILADPVQIEQMLLNLVANARDAMPRGGSLSIRTKAVDLTDAVARQHGLTNPGRYVRIVVEDSGIGIDEQTRERIFEPFFTTKQVGKGTGLGLSTVFAITRQLGGRIGVHSEPGRGTRFTIHLPCQAQSTPALDSPGPEAMRFRGTALLVEDDRLVRMTVRHYLQALGLDVLEAGGAAEAVAVCANHSGPVDLLLADIILPGMRGPRLAEMLTLRYPDLRILFMSANPEFHGDEAETMSELPVLHKPFGREELADELRELLGAEFAREPAATHNES